MKSIKFKLAAIGAVPVALFLILIMFYVVPVIKNSIYEEKQVQTREMTTTALGILEHYYQLEQEGVFGREDAQNKALQVIKSMTFGRQRLDYFWVNDFHPRMIMHPFRPDLDGEDISGFRDPEGVYLFREFVDVVRQEGGGYVPYHWQYYDDQKRIEPKLSYVSGFEPWQWIIGTGVYVNDVKDIADSVRNTVLLWTLTIFIIIFFIVSIILLSILRPLLKAVSFADAVAGGKLGEKLEIRNKDELGVLSDSLNMMVSNLKTMILKARSKSHEADEQARKAVHAAREAELARQQAEAAGTETQRALDALRESEEKLNALFASMTEMVVLHEMIFDEHGKAINYRIADCNEAFTRFTGKSKEEIKGKPATEAYQVDTPPHLEEYSQVALTGKPYQFDSYYAPKDRHLSISVVSPGPNRFATIATDITAVKKMQQMIAAKNKELEQVVYIASHDLRSPLVNVDGYGRELGYALNDMARALETDHTSMEALKAELKTPMQDMIDALHYISSSTNQMDALLNGLLKLSRTGRVPLNIGQVNMNDLLDKVVSAMEFQLQKSGVEVHVGELPPCRGDSVQLTQVFSNLLGNAFKYLDPSRPGVVRVSGHVQKSRCVYCVEDNGIGIDPAHQQNIFEVFHRLDPLHSKGEGLGLTIVRQVLERLGGNVRVESEPGRGASFFVELPSVHGG